MTPVDKLQSATESSLMGIDEDHTTRLQKRSDTTRA